MRPITIKLFANLKVKAGFSEQEVLIQDDETIGELKKRLEDLYPGLKSHLTSVLVLIGQKSALNEDSIPQNAIVSFLTPIGGG
jgi:molybdopterin converting factor small subunit